MAGVCEEATESAAVVGCAKEEEEEELVERECFFFADSDFVVSAECFLSFFFVKKATIFSESHPR